MKYDLDGLVSQIYADPIGHDVLDAVGKLHGMQPGFLSDSFFEGMTIRSFLHLFTGGTNNAFCERLFEVMKRSDKSSVFPFSSKGDEWWRTAVFYQIYPRSFCDGNGDGDGDLKGIISKLDYLQDLGVDCLWLSPIYDSPETDNGYDIRDYRQINRRFGSLEDFDRLLSEVHKRGMRLIMDLVMNHTSCEHIWYRKALENPHSPYRDYYFFARKANNWDSFFGGKAWKKNPDGTYSLHLFSDEQMDLNWDNPAVRNEMIDMIRWWLEKGIDGFRMDVINYISKPEGLPDGDETWKTFTGFSGVEQYVSGPHLHQYLHELKEKAFAPYHAFTVGETPYVGTAMANAMTDPAHQELDLVFLFEHLENVGHNRFETYRYDLNEYKRYMENLYRQTPGYWPALFFENHDNPRMVSKVEPDFSFRTVVAKLLGTLMLTLRGTPFIYQGQELGAVNQHFSSISQMRDVESVNRYQELRRGGASEGEALEHVASGSRDNVRVMFPWGEHTPSGWIQVDEYAKQYSAEKQTEDPFSVFSYFRNLLQLRRRKPILATGAIRFLDDALYDVMTYTRTDEDGEGCLVECNLSKKDEILPTHRNMCGELLLSNYVGRRETLRPYETNVYRIKKEKAEI